MTTWRDGSTKHLLESAHADAAAGSCSRMLVSFTAILPPHKALCR